MKLQPALANTAARKAMGLTTYHRAPLRRQVIAFLRAEMRDAKAHFRKAWGRAGWEPDA